MPNYVGHDYTNKPIKQHYVMYVNPRNERAKASKAGKWEPHKG